MSEIIAFSYFAVSFFLGIVQCRAKLTDMHVEIWVIL